VITLYATDVNNLVILLAFVKTNRNCGVASVIKYHILTVRVVIKAKVTKSAKTKFMSSVLQRNISLL